MSDATIAVQVRNVPTEVADVFRRRAAAEGKSLQEYLLELLVAQAGKPTRKEILDGAARRATARVDPQEVADAVRAERAERGYEW